MPRMVKRPTTSYTTFTIEEPVENKTQSKTQSPLKNYGYFNIGDKNFIFNLIENHSDLTIDDIKNVINFLNQEDLSQNEQLKNIKMKIFNNLPHIKGKLINNLIDDLLDIYHQSKEPLTTENNNPKLSKSEIVKTLANSKNKSSDKNNETTKSKTSKEVKEKLYVVNYQNPDNPEEVATKSSVRNPKWLMEKLNLGFELKDFEVEPFEIRKGIDKVTLGKFLHSKETQEVDIKNNENTENVVTDKKPSQKASKKEVEQEITTVYEKYLPVLNNEEKAKKLENIEEAYYQALSDVEKFYNEHANYDVPSVSLIKREINKFEKIWSQFKDYNSDEDIAQEQQTWVMRLKELVGKSQNSNVNLDSNNNQKKNLIDENSPIAKRLLDTNNSEKIREFNVNVDNIYKEKLTQIKQNVVEKKVNLEQPISKNQAESIQTENFENLVDNIIPNTESVEEEDLFSEDTIDVEKNKELEDYEDSHQSLKNQMQSDLEKFFQEYEKAENFKNLTDEELNDKTTLLSNWRNTPPKNEELADQYSSRLTQLVKLRQENQSIQNLKENIDNEISIEDDEDISINEDTSFEVKNSTDSIPFIDEYGKAAGDDTSDNLADSANDENETSLSIGNEKKNDIEAEITEVVDELGSNEVESENETVDIDEDETVDDTDELEAIYTQTEPVSSLENQLPTEQECITDNLNQEVDKDLVEVDENQQLEQEQEEITSSNLLENIQNLDTSSLNSELQNLTTLTQQSTTSNSPNTNQTTPNKVDDINKNQANQIIEEELNPFKGNYDLPNFDEPKSKIENSSNEFELDIEDEEVDSEKLNDTISNDSNQTPSIKENKINSTSQKTNNTKKTSNKKEKVVIKNEQKSEPIGKLAQIKNKFQNLKNNLFKKNESNNTDQNTPEEVKNNFSKKIKLNSKLTLFGGLFILLFLLLAGGYFYLQQNSPSPIIVEKPKVQPTPTNQKQQQTQQESIQTQVQNNEKQINLETQDLFDENDLLSNDELTGNSKTNNTVTNTSNQVLEKINIDKNTAKIVSVKVNNEDKKVSNQSKKENEKSNTTKEVNKGKNNKSKNNDLCNDIANVKGRLVVPMGQSNLTSFLAGEAKFKNGCHLYAGKKIGKTQVLEIDINNLSIKTTNGIIYFE